MPSERAVLRTYVAIGGLLAVLPEPVALGAARLAGDVLYRLRSDQRETVVGNLRRVMGPGADRPSLERLARRAFHGYSRYWVEGARLPTTSRAEVRQRAEQLEPPELFDHFVAQREAMGLTIVPLGAESGASVLQTLRAGGLVGLLCDRDIVGNGIEVELFGEKTTMPAGPAVLAMRTGAVLLTAAVYSGPGRDHHAVVHGPIDTGRTGSFRADVRRITQEIADRFEGLIRRAPEQWHVFQPLWTADLAGRGPVDG